MTNGSDPKAAKGAAAGLPPVSTFFAKSFRDQKRIMDGCFKQALRKLGDPQAALLACMQALESTEQVKATQKATRGVLGALRQYMLDTYGASVEGMPVVEYQTAGEYLDDAIDRGRGVGSEVGDVVSLFASDLQGLEGMPVPGYSMEPDDVFEDQERYWEEYGSDRSEMESLESACARPRDPLQIESFQVGNGGGSSRPRQPEGGYYKDPVGGGLVVVRDHNGMAITDAVSERAADAFIRARGGSLEGMSSGRPTRLPPLETWEEDTEGWGGQAEYSYSAGNRLYSLRPCARGEGWEARVYDATRKRYKLITASGDTVSPYPRRGPGGARQRPARPPTYVSVRGAYAAAQAHYAAHSPWAMHGTEDIVEGARAPAPDFLIEAREEYLRDQMEALEGPGATIGHDPQEHQLVVVLGDDVLHSRGARVLRNLGFRGAGNRRYVWGRRGKLRERGGRERPTYGPAPEVVKRHLEEAGISPVRITLMGAQKERAPLFRGRSVIEGLDEADMYPEEDDGAEMEGFRATRRYGVDPDLVRRGVQDPETGDFLYSTAVQTVLFPRERFSVQDAKDWLERQNAKRGKRVFKYGKVHRTDDYLRFRQRDPDEMEPGTFRTMDVPGTGEPPIKFVIGVPAL